MYSKSKFLISILLGISSQGVQCATITGVSTGTNNPAFNYPYEVSLDPDPVLHLNSIGAAPLQLLRQTYSNWTFTSAGTQAPGTFDILQYQPFALPTLGGADFSVIYSDGKGDMPTDLSWIQIAYAHNFPNSGVSVDSLVTGSPFYSTDSPNHIGDQATPKATNPRYVGPDIWKNATDYPQQHIQNPAGGGNVPAGNLAFVDEPKCFYSCVPKNDFSSLYLELYLVSFTWNGKTGAQSGGTVTIYDGIGWGVEITCQVGATCPPVPEPPGALLTAFGAGLIAVGGAIRSRYLKAADHGAVRRRGSRA